MKYAALDLFISETISAMPRSSIPLSMLANPIHLLALGFGSGLSPKAPGTLGTLVAIPIYYFIFTRLSLPYYLLATALICCVGVWICAYTASALNTHDHPGIVWDEIAGYLITMILVPEGVWFILLGFALFRFFDILKPWPISWCDRKVHGGLGIMLDDIVAGVLACSSLHLLVYLFFSYS